MYKQNKTEIRPASSVTRDTQELVLATHEKQENPTATNTTDKANKDTVIDVSDTAKHERKTKTIHMQKSAEGLNKTPEEIAANQARMEPENIQSIEKTDGKTHPKTDVRHEKKKRDSHKSRRKIANEDSTKQKGISSEGSSMTNIESPKSTSKDTVSPLTPSAAPDISVLLNQQNQDKGVKYDMFQQAMTPSTDVTIKKPAINADDLLIKKRMLKKVDRHSEYNPVTLSRKELFEEEFEKSGNIPPEYLPIHIVKPIIIQQNLSADLVTLNLNGIDQLTDFLFAHLHGGGMTTVPKFSNLKKLNMVGCTNISDQGLIWITRLFPDIQMLEVNACRKITEKGLHHLFSNCNKLQNVSAMATNAAIIPDSYVHTRLSQGSFQWAGNPLISEGKQYSILTGENQEEYKDLEKRKLVILRDGSLDEQVLNLLSGGKNKTLKPFSCCQSFVLPGTTDSNTWNIFEIPAQSPLKETLVSEGSVVMIVYTPPTEDTKIVACAENMADIIASVIIKCSDVVFLLVEVSDTPGSSKVKTLIKRRIKYLIKSLYAATYELYQRNYQLEHLDFKGQQGLAWGISSLESLENLVEKEETQRMTTINVTRESFQKDVTSALTKCAENVKVLVPWVHCEWSKKTLEIIDKLPKSGFTDQKSLFHQTDVEAKAQGYTKYSYQKLGKVLNLLHYWGNGLHLWHQRKSLCATDLMAYESLLVKFLTTTPPDKVRVTSIGHSVPCWKVKSFEAFIQAEKLHGEALKAADIFKRQGLLIELSAHLFEKSQDGDSVYVRMSDIPESHSMLESLWPEPCPQQRIIQTNRCYNFLPIVPEGFMSKLLRSVLKVFQPLCIWRTGFLIRQGPVDIRASLHRYKGDARLDKTPVLVVSARAVDIRQKKSSSIIDSSQEARSTMFAALRQVLLVVDSVVQKMELYGFVTLVCPECSESNTEKMIDVTKTWHLPYYIGLISSRHKHCKSHPKIDHNYLCEPQTEQGESLLIPHHNYPYMIDANVIVEDTIRADRHRPMDSPEKCFYCGGTHGVLCLHCHMCSSCVHQFAKMIKVVQPGHITSKSFKLQKYVEMQLKNDDRIVSNTKGSVYYYKKGHRMNFLPPMTPFFWDEAQITISKGANFFLVMTFGTGVVLEYRGIAGEFVNQQGKMQQKEVWKSRDANLINVRLESVEVGKRVRVVIAIKGLDVLTEEVEGWHMRLELLSKKAGYYTIHTPGIKREWQWNENYFSEGSCLEVMVDENTTHPAVIKEKSADGYLTLDVNGEQMEHVYTSPKLRPAGTTSALSTQLASALKPGETGVERSPVPVWSFLKLQVPCGFKALLTPAVNSRPGQSSDQERPQNLVTACTGISFPSVLYAKQVQLRDSVEKIMFTDGKWNFPMTALMLLPSRLSKVDMTACSQQSLTGKFKLHPLCCFRGDVNTVLSSGPCVPQLKTLECYHVVHMLDNTGFELDNIRLEDSGETPTAEFDFDQILSGQSPELGLLWAWMIMVLRLQHDDLTEIKKITKDIPKIENVSTHQVNSGLRQVLTFLSQALFMSFGKDFQFKEIISEATIELWSALMLQFGESQGLVRVAQLFTAESILVCESHSAAWQVNRQLEHFSELPGLYPQFVYSLNLSGNKISDLPPQLFTSMPNLKDLCVSNNRISSIPVEIGNCKQLSNLAIAENNLKDLPSTLHRCQDILRLDMEKNNFTELPAVVLKLKNLKRLYAQHLQLLSLPENIGDLDNLETLSLSGNCLTSLPDSMRKMQKLTTLSLNGVVWLKSRSNSLLSRENFEDFLKVNNLHQWLDRRNQDKSSIFQLFDEDTNGTLDSREIGKLNATMFHIFPRFGYMGKQQPDDDTPSGFPEVLFELKNLQYLSLQYLGIVSVPEDIKKLTKLSTLHLGNNPNLLTISAHVGSLPLKRLELEACPRLKTPPKEIRAKGFVTTMAYLKRLVTGSVTCHRTKLMLVGLGGAGKTSLVRTLLSGGKTKLTMEEELTDGIDISSWSVPTEEGELTFSVWDFAGQTVYYNTHQFFLSDRAVYLLLWNIRLGHEHAGLQFWLSSVSVHAPKAPIFVIGTHLDKMSKVELPVIELQKKYPQIIGFHFVSSLTGQGIEELKKQLIQETLKQQYIGEKIPGVWLSFEESIKSIHDKNVIEYKELETRANRSGIFDSTEVAQAVQFLHELGSLQHFSNANLKSHVVINPQWIVDVMACVVSVKDSHIKDGRLLHSELSKVWEKYDPSLYTWLLKLTEEFDLTFPLKDEPVNLVPCLLPEVQPQFDWPELHKNSFEKETKIVYKFDYLPAGLFNRGQVRLHQFSDSALIWKRGSYLKKNGHICLIQQTQECELTVRAHGPHPDNVVLLVHEMFESLIIESFQGIMYDFFLPCPDCMNVAAKDPHMFPASIIRRATELKSPFLQCLKYFHTISMTDLHAIMPPDNNQDFDLHLVQAVRGMKELQKDLIADIFVCFCEKDNVARDKESVLPSRVVEDVEKTGYKCWKPKESESIDEMAKALVDVKIFLVFMSNNFVQDELCCNLFKYARLTLRKPIILVAIGENTEWTKSNMGILVVDEVYVNMMKASRYNHKMEELTAMLKEKHAIKKERSKSKHYPPCFISYSWLNSAQAVAKGSRKEEGAIGYGDPREIKSFLEQNGIKCWIDVERVGAHGLFEDIGEGLINCQVVVVCISDEYTMSENCEREFRYAANTLKLPIVLAVVGTGNKWRAKELGILSLTYPLVSFQEKSETAMGKLLELVRSNIPNDEQARRERKSERKKRKKDDENKQIQEQKRLSFQELCELAQRKFLRQVSQYADRIDIIPYPNLMMVDLCPEEKAQEENPEKHETETNETKRPQIERKFSKLSAASEIYDQKFCVYLLCEHEEGWHTSGNPILLDSKFGHNFDKYLPYVARITAIAKFSKKIVLNSLTSEIGQKYLKLLEESPTVALTADLQESYGELRQMVLEVDAAHVKGKLERCLLPSGKHIWLCEAHRKNARVTVMSRESVVNTLQHQSETLGVDHMLQALQELDPLALPQKLRLSLAGSEGNSQVKTPLKSSPAKSSIKNKTELSQPVSLQTGVSDDNKQEKRGEHSTNKPQEENRPNTATSRACIVM